MTMNDQDLLTGPELESAILQRRRALLPLWIKIFTWIFLATGAIAMLILIAGVFGIQGRLSIYGFSSSEAFSPTGLLLAAIFVSKGLVAYGLWMEKEWAVPAARIDAIIGIVICVGQMIVSPFLGNSGFIVSLRLELVALIPYLIKMRKLHYPWKDAVAEN